jgi:hypothetical protein
VRVRTLHLDLNQTALLSHTVPPVPRVTAGTA